MQKLAENIWKINVDSNIYFLDLKEKIIIDTGPRDYRDIVKKELSKIIDLSKIEKVIFTHLHYDHTGNFDIFPNAKFYTSEDEISYYKKHKIFAIGDPILAAKFNIGLQPLNYLEGFDIIQTPGHTKGSFCLLYKKEKILFSGDTLFFNGYGRIDFPGSAPEKMKSSLDFLDKTDYKILAPGHDY
ncbi:MAG: MBL fold metallo-hydrolase [Nanoarchaeota archaeon]|nr:MBL fold metallo-hydrolase [Nanoarchaeota archaeon]